MSGNDERVREVKYKHHYAGLEEKRRWRIPQISDAAAMTLLLAGGSLAMVASLLGLITLGMEAYLETTVIFVFVVIYWSIFFWETRD